MNNVIKTVFTLCKNLISQGTVLRWIKAARMYWTPDSHNWQPFWMGWICGDVLQLQLLFFSPSHKLLCPLDRQNPAWLWEENKRPKHSLETIWHEGYGSYVQLPPLMAVATPSTTPSTAPSTVTSTSPSTIPSIYCCSLSNRNPRPTPSHPHHTVTH